MVVNAAESSMPRYVSEFVGTFLLVLTVGLNVLGGNSVWGVTSIACALMVGIYALGPVSGAHFNPAVTVAVTLSNKMEGGWVEAAKYIAVQCTAGVLAGLTYFWVYGRAINVAPGQGFNAWQAGFAELFYTFMLCFVVLNVACAKNTMKNQYFGLAIGFVIIAGGYAGGPISGGAFNPAVALGLDLSSAGIGFGHSLVYAVWQFAAAALAAGVFRFLRPEDFGGRETRKSLVLLLTSEFIGTFFLVLTVGLNVLNSSPAAAFSIAASLMCMIYALGDVSGAHFNPAVTLAILASGRQKINVPDAVSYMAVQILGGIVAAVTYSSIYGGAFALAPGEKYNWYSAGIAEFIFTFVLCFVVLNVATTKTPSKDMFGLAIGSCVTVGGCAIGAVSGGSLNPAVSFGIDTANAFHGGKWANCLAYSVFELAGGAAAAGAFAITRTEEYAK